MDIDKAIHSYLDPPSPQPLESWKAFSTSYVLLHPSIFVGYITMFLHIEKNFQPSFNPAHLSSIPNCCFKHPPAFVTFLRGGKRGIKSLPHCEYLLLKKKIITELTILMPGFSTKKNVQTFSTEPLLPTTRCLE